MEKTMAENFSRGNEISTLNDNYASDDPIPPINKPTSTIATENELITIYFGRESSNLCADLQEIFKKIDIADLNELRLIEIALRAKKNKLTKQGIKNDQDDSLPKKSYYQKKVREGAFYWNVRYTKNGKTVTEHLPDGLPLEDINPATTIVSFHPDYLKEKGLF